jgi:hypothetical protein
LSNKDCFNYEESVAREFLSKFPARIDNAESFAMTNRVILAKSVSCVGIDVSLGALPFEEDAISSATEFEFLPGINLLTISANDLVIMKAFAARGKDWEDIRGIIVRSRNVIDLDYIQSHLIPLAELKEEPEIVSKLLAMF